MSTLKNYRINPPTVILPCNQQRKYTTDLEFLGIEEDIQGRDVLTFQCPACGGVHKSLVFGR